MEKKDRLDHIMHRLSSENNPVAANALAGELNVSRQIIVSDVALLRAAGENIISTNRGYVLIGDNNKNSRDITKLIKIRHTNDELLDELFTIVDLGGEVINVVINHKVYGKMEADLNISSRRDAKEFSSSIESGRSTPLMNVTSNYHFHHIKAPSAKVMDEIIEALQDKGYLIEVMEGETLWN